MVGGDVGDGGDGGGGDAGDAGDQGDTYFDVGFKLIAMR